MIYRLGGLRIYPQNSAEYFFLAGGGGCRRDGASNETRNKARNKARNKMNSTHAVPSIDRLRLEMWPIARLIPSARNARTHSGAQIAEIAGSIQAFGFSNPILVGVEGDIVAGHGRLAAARQLGLCEVPVVILNGLTDQQRRQLMLADNRIALNRMGS